MSPARPPAQPSRLAIRARTLAAPLADSSSIIDGISSLLELNSAIAQHDPTYRDREVICPPKGGVTNGDRERIFLDWFRAHPRQDLWPLPLNRKLLGNLPHQPGQRQDKILIHSSFISFVPFHDFLIGPAMHAFGSGRQFVANERDYSSPSRHRMSCAADEAR